MHCKTFDVLRQEADHTNHLSLQLMIWRLGKDVELIL